MIYSTAEIIGIVALLLAFLAAGFALSRLDAAISGPRDETEASDGAPGTSGDPGDDLLGTAEPASRNEGTQSRQRPASSRRGRRHGR
jgi:hypothetical protein